ncbi:HAD-IB family hydrolase [Kitasatospora sp. NPDC002040]|uniref:HAD family hydrolase n=1 Tax=Kitasatospora sp. NPDC002040 TaxID=3154661 RepID=UPI0033289FE4
MTIEAVAFSDVDETLINAKSMFRFLEFRLRERGEPEGTYERLAGELREAARTGVPRADINRRYYRLFKGEEAAALAASGRRWLIHEQEQHELRGSSLFLPQVEQALAGHRAAGEPVVLVSGSFFACLDPVAERVGAQRAIGTRPLIRQGRLTGEVLFPLIGPAKGRIAHVTAALLGVDLADCTAYGDHISDLDLLEAVGRPVAVGEDAELGAHAEAAHWTRLRTGLVAAGI